VASTLNFIPLSEALGTFLQAIPAPQPQAETVKSADALGRVLLKDIISAEMSPPFSRSAMDGYAVIAADTTGASAHKPVTLPVVAEIGMGKAADTPLQPGTAMLIHTGGMLPPGADAVVILEDTQAGSAGQIEIFQAAQPGDNVISAGEDVRPGDVVLRAGTRIGPAVIGGLLALGIMEIPAAKAPLVGILSSGDELILPEQKPDPGQIRDVNSYTLAALMRRYGAQTRLYGIAPDEMGAFENLMRRAFAECDMLIVTAGSSASARDLSAAVIRKLGKPGVLAHGVKVRPGKPTILAVCDGKPVIGLPGNPVSALVIASLCAVPALEKLMDVTRHTPRPVIRARLSGGVESVAGREDFVPVALTLTPEGYSAEPIAFKSNLIFTLAKAGGLLRVPAGAASLQTGEVVEVDISLQSL
jgi:molybdopterin molybdotransferase